MKALYDIFSIIIFVIAYVLYGFYAAVAVINILMFISVMAYRIKFGKFDRMQTIIFLVVFVLSLPTFILHNEIFFKWKPTIISWLFGVGLFFTQLMGEKRTLFQRILEKEKITVPRSTLTIINIIWVIYFMLFGIVNIIVAYTASTNTWVWFKLGGSLGAMIILSLLTIIILYPHLKKHHEQSHD